jgi:hypothetical protein
MTIETIPITDRESWLAMRRKDVTASVAGALLGVHDHMTAYQLWALKAGKVAEDPEENEAMRRGRLLEPVAKQLLAEKHPEWKLADPGVYIRDTETRTGCTPDLYVECPVRGPGVVQIKTTADIIFKRKWRDPSTYQITLPLWIAVQTMMEQAKSGRAWGSVALMVVGMGLDLYEVDVPLHKGVLARVDEEVAAFWALIDDGEEMAPDYAQDAATIAKVYNEGADPPLDLNDDNRMRDLIARHEALGLTEKAAKADKETVAAEIKHKLGNHEAAFCGGRVVTWKLQHRKEFTTKANSFRVLRIN